MRTFLFGYGSLLNRASASRVLKREIALGEFLVASLPGYKRVWTLKERVFAQAIERTVAAVFLDLEQSPSTECNGLLIELSEAMFTNLRMREKNYDVLDVSQEIRMPPGLSLDGSWHIYTFVGKPEFRPAPSDHDLYVMERYVAMIQSACGELGDEFSNAYVISTAPAPYRLLPGEYVFTDPDQAEQA